MLLHTICYPESVLEGYDSHHPDHFEIEGNGYRLIIELETPTSGKIVRLISPRADHYLDSSLQPGTIISFPLQS